MLDRDCSALESRPSMANCSSGPSAVSARRPKRWRNRLLISGVLKDASRLL